MLDGVAHPSREHTSPLAVPTQARDTPAHAPLTSQLATLRDTHGSLAGGVHFSVRCSQPLRTAGRDRSGLGSWTDEDLILMIQ